MPRRSGRDLTIGVVAALALSILSLAVMVVGEESAFFAQKTDYRVIFPDTIGLRQGSPVMISGVQVGTVRKVRLPTDTAAEGIEVVLGVDNLHAPRIREGSRAALRILQLLSGEKYVEIVTGTADSAPLPANAEIPLLDEEGLLEQGEYIADNLNDVTQSLKGILEPLERGESLLGEMIQNPEFGRKGLDDLQGILNNLEKVTGQIRSGRGFAGRLLYDQEFAGKVDDLGSAIEDLAGLLGEVGAEKTSLRELLAEDGPLRGAAENLRTASASFSRTAEKIETGDGLLSKLIHDEEFSRSTAEDLSATLANLREITDKINRGEGTIGALINERGVYEGAESITTGVNDSKFMRWLLRRYRKKGIELQEEGQKEE
ncbi:hypothetical protein ABI59_04800 [Acidobacteria bacterium Mor1]|nr:hypothetical protein ABI59_04800 [Acidobacteria bacterium Mor1]